ncbi:MAG: hypothetical protein ACJA1L_000539, partial [Paracoccaceae bacterium]
MRMPDWMRDRGVKWRVRKSGGPHCGPRRGVL